MKDGLSDSFDGGKTWKKSENIIEIERDLPHITAECICVKCLDRGIHVFPECTWLKNHECGNCGEIGYIILTGQPLEEN